MSAVEFRRVARGRVWHIVHNTDAVQPAYSLCAAFTEGPGVERLPDRPPLGARVCPRCVAVCELLGAVGREHKP